MERFQRAHEEAFGDSADVQIAGVPDWNGNGRYGSVLGYKQWYKFNNIYRVHQNFVEMMPQLLGLPLVCGLVFP